MLKYRILTAIILIPLVFWLVLGVPQEVFGFVMTGVALIAAWEWAAFLGWTTWPQRLGYAGIVLAALGLSLTIPNWVVIVIGVTWWMLILFLILWIELKKSIPNFSKISIALMGIVSIVPFWLCIVLLHLEPRWLLLLLLLVWIADIAAYFGGRFFGRNKLAPTISPNKTWAGVYTAFIAISIFIIGGVLLIFNTVHPLLNALSLGMFTLFAAVVGDLFESVMKRQCGLKDSGQLLPGHGGFLDRIDSLIAAAPLFLSTLITLKILH